MRIDGRGIAEQIRKDLKIRIDKLKRKGIIPKIAIITTGEESAWESYVKQKLKVADELGIEAVHISLADASETALIDKIDEINNDDSFHGMIVQRPLPEGFDREKITNSIAPKKDVDGFRNDSEFEVPVWLAVRRLLNESIENSKFEIRTSNVVVVGKGETAGGPIIRGLQKMGIEPEVIDSKTQNPSEILGQADVIISCTGRYGIVTADNIKPGVVLIGVGTRGEDGKLKGDYKASEIENIAFAHTTTPGGVGPVNLSYLFKNLIEAAEKFQK